MISRIFYLFTLALTIEAANIVNSLHQRSIRCSGRISEQKCVEYTEGTSCLGSYDDIDPTLVETAKIGEFPHLAFLRRNNSDIRFVCTGSLISPRYVLTAAHCTATPSTGVIRLVVLGAHNIDLAVADGTTPVQVPIKHIIRHPDYRRSIHYNDIALLELDFEVAFNAKVRPACLWTGNLANRQYKAVISTLDYTLDPTLRQHEILKVSATLKDSAVCNETFPHRKRWLNGIDATQLCAQEATGPHKQCKAMGGSPLQIVTKEKNNCIFQIAALTSFGSQLCDTKPTVFTKVADYIDWIESVVWP